MKHKDFEDFLRDKYSNIVHCTEKDTNDKDLWEERYNEWIVSLYPDHFIRYADEYASTLTKGAEKCDMSDQ